MPRQRDLDDRALKTEVDRHLPRNRPELAAVSEEWVAARRRQYGDDRDAGEVAALLAGEWGANHHPPIQNV